jgi:hypothetical protein
MQQQLPVAFMPERVTGLLLHYCFPQNFLFESEIPYGAQVNKNSALHYH